MSKTINSTVQASIDSGKFAGVILAQLHFSPILRYTNAYQNIYWDEGSGDEEYVGLGHLASLSVLTETSELAAQTIQLSISGVPNEAITDIFSTEYIGKPAFLWYATIDKETYAVEGGSVGPVLIFAGSMDYGNVVFGQGATITLNITSRLADWERPRGGRFNAAYQNRHVDSTDKGFKYVKMIQNLPISWGGDTLVDPGNSLPEMCFEKGTRFFMQDGSCKEIQDILPGDIMLQGGLVFSVSMGLGHYEHWYDYKGTIVTASHSVLENGSWLLIKDSIYAVKTHSRPFTYILDNANSIMIAENREIFTDYHVVPAEERKEMYGTRAIDYLNSRTELNEELGKLKI